MHKERLSYDRRVDTKQEHIRSPLAVASKMWWRCSTTGPAKHQKPPGLENGMEEMPVEEEEEDLDFIPDPRASSKLNFKFTPRLFPTPLRESKRTEEGDWISKNRSHLKTHPHFMNNKAVMEKLDGDITERDPTWQK